MRVSAKADYAVRATAELAAGDDGAPVPAESLAEAQHIPHRFLESILRDLRREGIVASRRGARGGYVLARPADQVTVADVVRAVDGPLVFVRDERPADLDYEGAAADLLHVWVALRASVRRVLEEVTVSDLAAGSLPDEIRSLTSSDSAWQNP
ncbi:MULTISPECIES: Rrf2 family transcriptional regulator [Isoptericola]|uniref:Rrf2 family transcriptional regulator n=1 Tax=Isoptericola sediminis TaxID=2733572 RepID=A0A849K761_9MICO|nr:MULTISPECIES: Rrf2 family transcriptional regulator [unclassified Isoptericola]MDO8145709.1 Rrf2 family transcriptional regulator [Isoptericola sp. 178]MDO8149766.1 Rrf2 family transcriptional regulator [Isoptericola sp. b515]MDO8152049.1 Rrf2 family transcriptional regulator [Isoptericola sp. b408]NNU28861.1 Rrf2 family transcriptional regulator [Isoptericola sediminis]